MRVSIPSLVLGVTTLLSLLACGDVAGVSGSVGISYGDCDAYGQVCDGQAYEAGAFEVQIVPFADDTYGVTVTVTFEDAAAGEDVVVTQDLYADYNGEYWFYSPAAPPEGRVEIEIQVFLQYDYSVDAVCQDAPQVDIIAYNNMYEVDVDLGGSTPCYARVDLRDMVD